MTREGSHLEQEFLQRKKDEVRLNKYISDSGLCSRREADRLIEAGRVLVDGRVAHPGEKVRETQEVSVDGKSLQREEEMVLLAVNKPRGVVCTTEKKWGDRTIEEVIRYPKRIFYMGRLDKDSEGLLLMTNNGEVLDQMMRGRNCHEKEYHVWVDKPVTEDFLKGMARGGIPIDRQLTKRCRIKQTGENRFTIILTQGLNRQIRRMCEYFGYRVTKLVRVRVMNIRLGDLKEGEYRKVTREEQEELYRLLRVQQKRSR